MGDHSVFVVDFWMRGFIGALFEHDCENINKEKENRKMKDLLRVKQNEKGHYVEYIIKDGKEKGRIVKVYGQLKICKACHQKHFATNVNIQRGWGNFCSHFCLKGKNSPMYRRRGKIHPAWKGGKYYDSHGYIYIYKPNHPFCTCQGYIRRSHLVMEKSLGRYLKSEEIVHHRKKRDDDRIENLRLFENEGQHQKFERTLGKVNI